MGTLIVLVLAVVVSGLLPATNTTAQANGPEPGEAASLLMPAPDAFGPGWTRIALLPVESVNGGYALTGGVFREGAAAVYGGPQGARVVTVAMLIDQERVAIRRAWEEATVYFNTLASPVTYDYNLVATWDALPAPASCAEAKRIEGVSRDFGFPTGVTLCAADPDLVVIVVASGSVNDRGGHQAADKIVETIMANRG